MQRGSSHLRKLVPPARDPDAREPITEPSGPGPFAEAMRELIADLNPLPVAGQLEAIGPANSAGSTRHLRLVR